MNGDPKRALVPVKDTALPDRAQREALLSRARKLLIPAGDKNATAIETLDDRTRLLLAGNGHHSAVPYQPARMPATGPETVRLPGYCSVYGEPFLFIALRQGDKLTVTGAVRIQPGAAGIPVAMVSLGALEIHLADNWPGCPHCGTKRSRECNGFWQCREARCGDERPFHCAGNRRGWFRCACGESFKGPCEIAERFEVRTMRSPPATPRAPAPHAATPKTQPATAVSVRSAAGDMPVIPESYRLTWKG